MKFDIKRLAAVAVAASALVVNSVNTRAADMDIVDTAVSAGQFKSLAAALGAAGLVETLKGPGPYTVFAPTDEAFAKLGTETLNKVLADRDLLRSILLYHVVDGSVGSGDVVNLTSATTLNGAPVSIAVVGGSVVLNGNSTVTAVDIGAKNGVIHVIDTVLLPPAGE